MTKDEKEIRRQLVHQKVEHQLLRCEDKGEESGITIKQASEIQSNKERDEKLSGFDED